MRINHFGVRALSSFRFNLGWGALLRGKLAGRKLQAAAAAASRSDEEDLNKQLKSTQNKRAFPARPPFSSVLSAGLREGEGQEEDDEEDDDDDDEREKLAALIHTTCERRCVRAAAARPGAFTTPPAPFGERRRSRRSRSRRCSRLDRFAQLACSPSQARRR